MLPPLFLLTTLTLLTITTSTPHHPKPRAPQTSTATPSAPSLNPPFGSKRGLAYNEHSPSGSLSLFTPHTSITWGYNWNSSPRSLPSRFAYVPELHSLRAEHTSDWDDNVHKALASSSTTSSSPSGADGEMYLMSFNEPDLADQANISVTDAVQGFAQYMMPFATSTPPHKDGLKLGSPAVSNVRPAPGDDGKPKGLPYLKAFLAKCETLPQPCRIDFVPIHWYGCRKGCPLATDVDKFKKHVGEAVEVAVYQGRQLPLWVTEFATFGDEEGFLKEVLPWLDGHADVERYSYFWVGEGSLVQDGGLSGVGEVYVS
ncbi:uncharacterized protein KY384_008870 [Bacidia gigantensis]|uniref:uncharacterized protein n=1 Tax=Bacidia gigantensis TaxID=2732470 RepID=UPI001D04BA23|nr:uncharacterized protein KY384_008870 [Bacidia gigantensis]KAG8525226.1 hypothetical protein KY384_008870 [Bacidia gigantensis]